MTETKPKHNEQKYRQCVSKQYGSYTEARKAFDALKWERKRIRKRADGHYDVVQYEPVARTKA